MVVMAGRQRQNISVAFSMCAQQRGHLQRSWKTDQMLELAEKSCLLFVVVSLHTTRSTSNHILAHIIYSVCVVAPNKRIDAS